MSFLERTACATNSAAMSRLNQKRSNNIGVYPGQSLANGTLKEVKWVNRLNVWLWKHLDNHNINATRL